MQIVLYEPEIPPNTGTIARLCAATTTRLNLIEPLGFSLEDRYLKRAGLDYWPHVDVRVWSCWDAFLEHFFGRLVLTSARQGQSYHHFPFTRMTPLCWGQKPGACQQQCWTRPSMWCVCPSGARCAV